jgi:hypothetical protein
MLLSVHLTIRTPQPDMPAASTKTIWPPASAHAIPTAIPPFYQKYVLNKTS